MAVPAIIAAIEKGSEKTEKSEKTESTAKNIPEKFGESGNIERSITDKLEIGSETSNAALEASIPDKYDIQHIYSTYEERLAYCPKNGGDWTGKIGESKFKPENIEAKKELSKSGKDGIEYKNGIPDFSPFAKDSVQIDKMTANRPDNYKQAYEKFAEKWNEQGFEGKSDWDLRSVQQYKKEHNYDMHECSDMKTMQLVPHSIHMEAKHIGGRSECAKCYNVRSKFDD